MTNIVVSKSWKAHKRPEQYSVMFSQPNCKPDVEALPALTSLFPGIRGGGQQASQPFPRDVRHCHSQARPTAHVHFPASGYSWKRSAIPPFAFAYVARRSALRFPLFLDKIPSQSGHIVAFAFPEPFCYWCLRITRVTGGTKCPLIVKVVQIWRNQYEIFY